MLTMRGLDLLAAFLLLLYVSVHHLRVFCSGGSNLEESRQTFRTYLALSTHVLIAEMTGSQVVARMCSMWLVTGRMWQVLLTLGVFSLIHHGDGWPVLLETQILMLLAVSGCHWNFVLNSRWAYQALVVVFGGSLMLYLLGAPEILLFALKEWGFPYLDQKWLETVSPMLENSDALTQLSVLFDDAEVLQKTLSSFITPSLWEFLQKELPDAVPGNVGSFFCMIWRSFLPYPLDLIVDCVALR